MINSIRKIRAVYETVIHIAQEIGDRAILLLEVSLLGIRFWLHKNSYSQDYQTPEKARHSHPFELGIINVSALAMPICLT
jgi:hypothetical protein